MIYKNLSNRSKYIMIGVFAVSVTFTFVYNHFFASSSNCQSSQDFVKDSYSGCVQNNFYDQTNHNNRTVTINRNGKPWEFIVSNDTLFFSFIKIGDSLVKKQNEDFIEIHRSNTVTNFKLNFGSETNPQL